MIFDWRSLESGFRDKGKNLSQCGMATIGLLTQISMEGKRENGGLLMFAWKGCHWLHVRCQWLGPPITM